jgi:hypothetical protein
LAIELKGVMVIASAGHKYVQSQIAEGSLTLIDTDMTLPTMNLVTAVRDWERLTPIARQLIRFIRNDRSAYFVPAEA